MTVISYLKNNAKKICTGGRKASSPNDAGKSGCPHTEGKDQTNIYHCAQKKL